MHTEGVGEGGVEVCFCFILNKEGGPMKWTIWLLIAFGAAAVIGAVAGIAVAMTGGSANPGVSKFKAVKVRDMQHGLNSMTSGDRIKLAYSADRAGLVRWEYQVGKSSAPYKTIIESTKDNPHAWTVPASLFGTIRFRVTSVTNQSVHSFSKPLSVTPSIRFDGPGTFAEQHWVTIGSTAKYTYPEKYPWMQLGGVTLSVRKHIASGPRPHGEGYTAVARARVALDTTARVVAWKVNVNDVTDGESYDVMLSTKDLKGLGYPSELQYTLPHPVKMNMPVVDSDHDYLCTVSLKADDTGVSGAFYAGQSVTLRISNYGGGSVPQHDWYYAAAGGDSATTEWKEISDSVLVDSTPWTVPVGASGSVTVRTVLAGDDAATTIKSAYGETTIHVGPYITMVDNPSEGKTIEYLASDPTTVSTITVLVTGLRDNVVLQNASQWAVGWVTDPSNLEEEAGVYLASPSVIQAHVLQGHPLQPHTTECVLRYNDPGYNAIVANAVKKLTAPLYVSFEVSSKTRVSVVGQAQYTLKIVNG